MTIDEAIKHAEEVAYQKDLESGFDTDNERYAMTDKERTACKECAEEHRQLAEWLKDYKRLLEQEPCENAVSIASVFEILGNLMAIPYDLDRPINKDDVSESIDKIRALPSVKPVQNWTPTSERLPKTNEYVGNVAKHYLIQDEFGDMEVAAYTTRGWIPIHTIEAFEYEVVAWQPLPKLYNAEKENEE